MIQGNIISFQLILIVIGAHKEIMYIDNNSKWVPSFINMQIFREILTHCIITFPFVYLPIQLYFKA